MKQRNNAYGGISYKRQKDMIQPLVFPYDVNKGINSYYIVKEESKGY